MLSITRNYSKLIVFFFAIVAFLIIMVIYPFFLGETAFCIDLPIISLSTSEWASSVTVDINYPSFVVNPTYQTVRNGVQSEIKSYTEPFIISTEGDTEVKAYYGSGLFVSSLVSNVDITPPSEPNIYLDINLMTDKNIVLQVSANDLKSGVNSVNIAVYNYQFYKEGDIYQLDMSNITIGDVFNIEILDLVGNKRTHSGYYYSVYDYVSEIREYALKFENLGDGSQYTAARWADIISAYENLEMAFKAPVIDSSEVNVLKVEIDELSEGEIIFSYKIVEPLIGMDSNILYAVSPDDLDVLLGSEVVLEISNSILTSQERVSYETILKTLSGYERIKLVAFKLELSEKTGEEVALSGSMNIDFQLPEGYSSVKLFDLEGGVFSEVILAVSGDRRSGRVVSDGDFFLVADASSATGSGNGYVINGRYYSLELFWGTIGGILGLLLLAFFIPFLLIQYKDKLSSNRLLSKIRKRNIERKKEKRK